MNMSSALIRLEWLALQLHSDIRAHHAGWWILADVALRQRQLERVERAIERLRERTQLRAAA